MAARKNILAYVQSVVTCSPYNLKVDDLTHSLKDGKALCALLHVADPSLFEWSTVLSATPTENAARGLDGFADSFLVPKLMDAEDIVTVPDDKGMTLYLSYIVDILQKKQQAKKSSLNSVRDPTRRASTPNIGSPTRLDGAEEKKVTSKPKYGGGGYIDRPGYGSMKRTSPQKTEPKDDKPAWVKKAEARKSRESGTPSLSSSPSSDAAPPRVVVPGPDPLLEAQEEIRKLKRELVEKEHSEEALKAALEMLEEKLDKKDRERADAEESLHREIVAAKAEAAAAIGERAAAQAVASGDAASAGAGEEMQEVRKALKELKFQVDDLEQENEMLQMSLEDSRRSQLELTQASRSSMVEEPKRNQLRISKVPQANEEEMLRHKLRDMERRATAAEEELEKVKASGGTTTSSSSSSPPPSSGKSPREVRLRKQLGEAEDRVLELEKDLRAAKRAADKVKRLERDLEEAEEREVAHSKELRELKRANLKLRNELEDAERGKSPRNKSASKLERSPRQASIPKLSELDGSPIAKSEEPPSPRRRKTGGLRRSSPRKSPRKSPSGAKSPRDVSSNSPSSESGKRSPRGIQWPPK